MTVGHVICPIHEYERQRCSVDCNAARLEFRRTSHLLRMYWYSRRRGQKPMDAFRYRLQFGSR